MKRAKPSKHVSKLAAEAAEPEYNPTPIEAEAVEAYRSAKGRKGPRVKFVHKGDNTVEVDLVHPSPNVGMYALMRALGTTDAGFYRGLMHQIVNASSNKGPSQDGANFMLAVITGIEPRDQFEAMLAAQMAAVHMASMTFAERLANVGNIPQQDSAERAFNKLTRTFAAQMETLKIYRSKGEQRMIVQHVNVSDGGQAIVGAINAPSEGGGAVKKIEDQPHALGYAPGLTLPREIEAEREAVPSAGGAGL